MTTNNDAAEQPAVDRRSVLRSAAVAGIGALAAASATARADDEHAGHDMKHMDHAAPAAH